MLSREVSYQTLVHKLSKSPSVVILGPRQVGKTTLAKTVLEELKGTYLDLESRNVQLILKEDAESFLSQNSSDLIVLDEVQVIPELFGILRSIIDKDRRPGRFLLLGSANPALVKGVSESLTGRVSYIDLNPLDIQEVGYVNSEKLWFRGGFPPSYLAEEDGDYMDWTRDYIRSYIERDINLLFGVNLNVSLIRRLWAMLAHVNGGLLNSADLGRSLGVSANTVNNYIEILEGAFLIFRLQPWFVNIGKRLVKSPKIYFSDTGLLHSISGIERFPDLQLHPLLGASWENFVIQQIRSIVRDKIDLYFYRTHNGSEIDLVLVMKNQPIAAIEIKNSNNPSISKGFYIGCEDLKTTNNFVITRDQSYAKVRGVEVISLSEFIQYRLPFLLKET